MVLLHQGDYEFFSGMKKSSLISKFWEAIRKKLKLGEVYTGVCRKWDCDVLKRNLPLVGQIEKKDPD